MTYPVKQIIKLWGHHHKMVCAPQTFTPSLILLGDNEKGVNPRYELGVREVDGVKVKSGQG